MTRPNITLGEWIQNADTVWRDGQPIIIHPNYAQASLADAKAIAALPKLLEALELMLSSDPKSGQSRLWVEAVKAKASEALTLAGYTF